MGSLEALPQESLADGVVTALRSAITRGELAPGARLIERQLAAQLQVSHIPVREAIARLVEEGLVDRLPRRGARVAELSPSRLEEISSLRVVLEDFVVRRVMERWTADTGRPLRGLATEMVAAAERGDVLALYDLDGRFHETLWGLAEHSLLVELASQMRGRISGFLLAATSALDPRELVSHAQSHVALVELLEAGDVAAARRGMTRHIEVARARIARSPHLTTDDVVPG
jgi:DNA-binding GntR family transcriptional regulator